MSILLSYAQLLQPYGLYPARILCPWISQTRILEWVAISFSPGDLPSPGIEPMYPAWKADSLPLSPKLTIKHYSAIKKNEIMLFAATWMNLEIITLTEVSQTKTNMYDITYM